ncbi:MAG: hypothetical protein ACOC7U_04735 [Spirochaetota bacterium]
MLITKKDVENILQYRFSRIPVTSLYLDVDPKKNINKEYLIHSKSLIKESKEKIENQGFSRENYYSVMEDFDRLFSHVESIHEHSFKGLACFSSSKNKFFQTFELDEPVKDNLVVGYIPYTKPLFSVLNMKKRYIALLFKKDKLRAFEVYGDTISEDLDLFTTSLFDSRANTYVFINEKKYQNRLETEYSKFLRQASDETRELFIRTGADYLVLGGEKNAARDFYSVMHPYLRDRFGGYLDVDFNAKNSDVLNEVQRIAEQKTVAEDRALVQKIHQELSKNGNACRGLGDVLNALSMAAVDVLAIGEGYSTPGYMDPEYGVLYPDSGTGQNKNLVQIDDVVNEAIDVAVHHGAEVRIIKDSTMMEDLDHIAALLRFKPSA